MAKTFHRDPRAMQGGKGRRRATNHLGRRIVQRWSKGSGPVQRFYPGTPEYVELMATRVIKDNTPAA